MNSKQATTEVKVRIAATCKSTIIFDETIDDVYYNIYEHGNVTIFSSDWTQLFPDCHHIQYLIYDNDMPGVNSSLSSPLFNYDNSSRLLTLSSDSVNDLGSYVIAVYALVYVDAVTIATIDFPAD